jgi:hypothetical protein
MMNNNYITEVREATKTTKAMVVVSAFVEENEDGNLVEAYASAIFNNESEIPALKEKLQEEVTETISKYVNTTH